VTFQGQALPPARPRRPPFTKRLRPGHWIALDILAAVACALGLFLALAKTVSRPDALWPGVRGVLLAALFALVLSAPVALRRRDPLRALAASLAGNLLLLVAAAIAAPAVIMPGAAGAGQAFLAAPVFLLPAAYVIHLVAAQYRRGAAVAALAVVLALLGTETLIGSLESTTSRPGGAVFTAFVLVILWMMGYGAAQRRAYAAQLQDQAAAGAVTEERLRIARELHDVVAHSMTVIAVQAGYGKHVIDGQPAQAAEALGAIQATSREALAEMRRMLGVLRQSGPGPSRMQNNGFELNGGRLTPGPAGRAGTDGNRASAGRLRDGAGSAAGGEAARRGGGTGAAPLAPAPGLADLGRLAARIGNAGVRVQVEVQGERTELPPGIDLAAFRIVQEALTNVVKHAGVPECRVVVRYGQDELSVEVTDDGRGSEVPAAVGGRQVPGADGDAGGHGLIGMRERVSLYGGELTAGPRPGRGFQVAARLPTGAGLR
jgi:signal transduction histidine kinase